MVRRSTYQNTALAVGVLLLAITSIAELAGWGEKGFGALQQLMLFLGAGVIAVGVLPQDGTLARMTRQLILLFGAAYFSLLLVEVGLLVVTPYEARIDPVITLRGSVVETPWGFNLTPYWTGVFQDGVVTADIEINSRGDRDAEPAPNPDRRVLLIGDSVAFGYGLPQHDTIDASIESLTKGRIDAYDLGVLGFGPGETVAKLEATRDLPAHDVIYIFNGNDLRDDARFGNYQVYEGYLVPVARPDGTAYTEEDYREHVEAKEDDTTLRKVLSLVGVRVLLGRLVEPDRDRVIGPLENYREEGIELALAATLRMKAVAESRGATFTVVVIPMKGEAAPETYAAPTREFIERLEAAGVDTLDLHARLTRADHYFNHDPHLNAEGARETARAIVERLEK